MATKELTPEQAAAKAAKEQAAKDAKAAKAAEAKAAKEAKAKERAEAKAKREAEKEAKAKAKADAKAAKEAEKAAKAKAREEAKAKREAAKAAKAAEREARKMPEQNGVRMRRPGTKCGEVWAICDRLQAELGRAPASSELVDALQGTDLNVNNAKCEYTQWRKYHGIAAVGVVKKAETPEEAKAEA